MPFDPFADPFAEAGDGHDDDGTITRDERLAEARRSAIEAGRRKGGAAGAAMAASMLAIRDIYEGPPKDELPVEIEASSEPHDVDRDGIDVPTAGARIPPLPRRDPSA